MVLCLAESLIECKGFSPKDQMERYVRWWKVGCLSSTGTCFDIGITTRTAPSCALPRAYVLHRRSPGRPRNPVKSPKRSTVHPPHLRRVLLFRRVDRRSSEQRGQRNYPVRPHYCPVPDYWKENPLIPEISVIAAGSFKRRSPPQICCSGDVKYIR